eukprot:16010053-Heterocapsa_arctica.AAC.1
MCVSTRRLLIDHRQCKVAVLPQLPVGVLLLQELPHRGHLLIGIRGVLQVHNVLERDGLGELAVLDLSNRGRMYRCGSAQTNDFIRLSGREFA